MRYVGIVFQRYRRCVAALATLMLMALPIAAAAQAVTVSYGVTGTLQKGMIVMLDPKDPAKVQALTNKKANAMQGVVVSASETPVTLSGDTSTNQVYVATAGKYDVLVSTQNGPIKAGDIVTISALDGIGMKADSNQSTILGKALENFDGGGAISGTATLTSSNGGTSTVAIGLVELEIGISHNPLAFSAGTDSVLPGFLRKAAQSIAGKDVGAARIYIGLTILLVTVIITGSLLYAGVRSSLIAIGRNPLARRSVLRGLLQVILISITIFVIGLGAIYLLLRL